MAQAHVEQWRINSNFAPYIAAGVAILIWGATPAATRVAVMDMDPLAAGVMRTLVAGALAVPFMFNAKIKRPHGHRQWFALLVTSLCGFVGFTLLFSLGVKMTSASHSALMNAAVPLFSGLFGVIAIRKAPHAKWFLGMAVSFAGVVYLILSKVNGGATPSLTGDLLCLMSSMLVGLGYVSGSRLSAHIGTLSVTVWGVFVASLIQLPLIFVLWDVQDVLAVSPTGWAAIGFLSLGATLIAYVAWYWGLAKGGVVRIAPMQFLMPIISLSLAVSVFGESLTVSLMLAAVMIVVGVALSRKG